MSKKSNLTALIGASLAALAAGVYISYTQGTWPFASQPTGEEDTGSEAGAEGDEAQTASAGTAPVDVALTNEVASYTEHNPNNAGDFTDDGATGNAD